LNSVRTLLFESQDIRLKILPSKSNADSGICVGVDDKHFFGGDVYAYRRAPLVLRLQPGNHKIDLRLVRDVRAMGAVGDPNISIKLKVEISRDSLTIEVQRFLVSDVVDGYLASPFASVPVRNNSKKWINIWNIMSVNVCFWVINASLPSLIDSGGTVYRCYAREDPVQAGTRPIEVARIASVCEGSIDRVAFSRSDLCCK